MENICIWHHHRPLISITSSRKNIEEAGSVVCLPVCIDLYSYRRHLHTAPWLILRPEDTQVFCRAMAKHLSNLYPQEALSKLPHNPHTRYLQKRLVQIRA
jgi:hypothetical protein